MENDKAVNLDVLDLCHILKTLGYVIKDIYKDKYVSEDCTEKYIQIKCNTSGIKVVLESKDTKCNCPEMDDNNDDNGKWEMSGTSGGVQVSKTQSGSAFHREFNQNVTQHVRQEMTNIVEMIRIKPMKPVTPSKTNLSISSSCLHMSPPRLAHQIKVDTPSRYRSLDTLNDAETNSMFLPEPRALRASQKLYLAESNSDIADTVKSKSSDKISKHLPRQNTYTACPSNSPQEPRTMPPSRTSSPVPILPAVVMLNLHHAEKLAEELLMVIQESIQSSETGNFPDEKSIASAMDVSKISSIQQPVYVPRGRSASTTSSRSTAPFSSSPNLCRIQESSKIPHTAPMKRLSMKSPSVSNYDLKGSKHSLPKSLSSGKSISPSFGVMGLRKSTGTVYGNQITGSYKSLTDRTTPDSAKSKLAPFKSPNVPTEVKPKKRNSLYSHIKSTIPRQSLILKK